MFDLYISNPAEKILAVDQLCDADMADNDFLVAMGKLFNVNVLFGVAPTRMIYCSNRSCKNQLEIPKDMRFTGPVYCERHDYAKHPENDHRVKARQQA